MIENLKEIQKGSSLYQYYYLSEGEVFSTDLSYTIFRVNKERTVERDSLFLNKKILREISSVLTTSTKIEINDSEIILKTSYSDKRYPQLPSKICTDLISLKNNLPLDFKKEIEVFSIENWEQVRDELANIGSALLVEGLLLKINSTQIIVSTSEGASSSFSLTLPIVTNEKFFNKSFTCNKEFIPSLKNCSKVYFITDSKERYWVVFEDNRILTYFCLKDSISRHTVYTNFDPLSFL